MNFDCPHCNRAQTATDADLATIKEIFKMSRSTWGQLGIRADAVVCANPSCRKPTITVDIVETKISPYAGAYVPDDTKPIVRRRLIPDNSAKPQPDFIPVSLREDYVEACRIRDLSPKASATLARRCLQGIIRDFAGIKERSLYHEIEKLRELRESGSAPQGISDDSIEALHHVRSLGNIGAHMERDIDVIIPVEPSEAQ